MLNHISLFGNTVDSRALQEAQDIFGVDFDFEEFDQYGEGSEEEEEDQDVSADLNVQIHIYQAQDASVHLIMQVHMHRIMMYTPQ